MTAAYQFARETNARVFEFNSHAAFIHSKFMLADPLGDSPVMVAGSANFSDPSTRSNDENMPIFRADRRVAGIYFDEFNRLLFHCHYRSIVELASRMRDDKPATRKDAP